MRRRVLRKSDVLHEGYVRGLKEANRVINRMINEYTTTAMYGDQEYSTFMDCWSDAKNHKQDFIEELEGVLEYWLEGQEEKPLIFKDYDSGKEYYLEYDQLSADAIKFLQNNSNEPVSNLAEDLFEMFLKDEVNDTFDN